MKDIIEKPSRVKRNAKEKSRGWHSSQTANLQESSCENNLHVAKLNTLHCVKLSQISYGIHYPLNNRKTILWLSFTHTFETTEEYSGIIYPQLCSMPCICQSHSCFGHPPLPRTDHSTSSSFYKERQSRTDIGWTEHCAKIGKKRIKMLLLLN